MKNIVLDIILSTVTGEAIALVPLRCLTRRASVSVSERIPSALQQQLEPYLLFLEVGTHLDALWHLCLHAEQRFRAET